jgi:tellurium resistance protein TerZ
MGINLNKGQTIDLKKRDGGTLAYATLGLGWDAKVIEQKGFFGGVKKIQQNIDLDASALLCNGRVVQEIVYWGHLASEDGTVRHLGDNLTGEGEGDDETIQIGLDGLPPAIDAVYLVVNSYSGETFSEIDNAFVRVLDPAAGDVELVRYELSEAGPHTAMIMAKLTRTSTGWTITAIGQRAQGRTAQELQAIVAAML